MFWWDQNFIYTRAQVVCTTEKLGLEEDPAEVCGALLVVGVWKFTMDLLPYFNITLVTYLVISAVSPGCVLVSQLNFWRGVWLLLDAVYLSRDSDPLIGLYCKTTFHCNSNYFLSFNQWEVEGMMTRWSNEISVSLFLSSVYQNCLVSTLARLYQYLWPASTAHLDIRDHIELLQNSETCTPLSRTTCNFCSSSTLQDICS